MNKQFQIWLAGVLSVVSLLLIWQTRPDGQFHLWVLDIGQGDSLLIQTSQGKQILIDGGPNDQVLSGLGSHMPFWDHTIEQVILTHNHADHLAGLLDVLRRYQVEKIWISGAIHTTSEYLTWVELLRDEHIPTEVVWAGKETTIDDVSLRVLFPLTDQTGKRPENQHDATIVTRLTYQQHTLLLTGDIEEQHERAILAANCPDHQAPCPALASEVLKEPHHGSKTGLLPEFLAAVAPKVAIISAGVGNPYGHPAKLILDRLAAAGVEVYRTDQDGTVEVVYPSGQLRIQTHR